MRDGSAAVLPSRTCRWLLAALAIAAPAVAGEAKPDAVLALGPLPAIAPVGVDKPRTAEFACEIDPKGLWPAEGDAVAWRAGAGAWQRTAIGAPALAASNDGELRFVAAYLDVGRFGEVEIGASGLGALRLFVDGEAKGSGDKSASSKAKLRRGLHRVLVRAEGKGDAALALSAKADDSIALRFTTDPRHPLSDLREMKGAASVSSPLISPDGALLAYTLRERSLTGASGATVARTVVFDFAANRVVASNLGDAAATPLRWTADASRLLLQSGTSLLLWSRADGSLATVLKDEPGLGKVALAADGSCVVFASTRGVEDKKDGPKLRTELRAKLSDWPTSPHLHLLRLDPGSGGARFRLTLPGDASHDAFELFPDGASLLWIRSVPIAERPWFQSEIHKLELASGADAILKTVKMGFENRPGLNEVAISPDGTKVAFQGPPSLLGAEAESETNAFDPSLWVLDLASGALSDATAGARLAVDGHLAFDAGSARVSFLAIEGSHHRLGWARCPTAQHPASVELDDLRCGDHYSAISVAPGGDVAVVASAVDRLSALYVRRAGAEGRGATATLAEPNAGAGALGLRLQLATPRDASFTLADGTPIEAWLYEPAFAQGATCPLITYYYGGATPTLRGFNDLHQFLAANGYAVLVINPRGCGGYGKAFSASHVGDWGDRAGADILLGLEKTLAAHPELDAKKVGCYGGSYGGFMTMHLVSHSDRFAAAVSMYGIADLASYFGDGTWGFTYGDQAMAKLYPWSDPEWYAQHSPLYRADRIHTPLLLLHGEADTNVPVAESEQMFTALKLLGRTVELVRFPGEDHGISSSFEQRALHREMLLDWFDRFLKDQPQAWEARN